MMCPKCRIELRQENPRYTFSGDDSKDTPTKAFMTVDLVCRNHACENYGKAQTQRSVPLN